MGDFQLPPADAAPQTLARAWYELARRPVELQPDQLAMLGQWPTEALVAPAESFAIVQDLPSVDRNDPGGLRFVGLRPVPAWPWPLVRFASFDFEAGWGAAQVAELAGWPPLKQLTGLHVAARGQAGAEALAKLLDNHPQLQVLSCDLLGAKLDAVCRVLLSLPKGLKSLKLQWVRCELADSLGAALARLPQLQSLTLESCPLSPAAWASLAACGVLGRLEHLRLFNTALDDVAVAVWLQTGRGNALRRLDLEDSPFNGRPLMIQGLEQLARAGWFDGLEFLRIGYHNVAGPALQAILAADLSHLRAWLLFCTGTADAGVDAMLAAHERLPALQRVWLSYCSASDAALRRLAAKWSAEELG